MFRRCAERGLDAESSAAVFISSPSTYPSILPIHATVQAIPCYLFELFV